MEETEETEEKQEKKHTKWVKSVMGLVALGEAAVIFIGLQFIPYGRGYNNPPVKAEPKWDSPKTRELFFRACGTCHSNEVAWPWYGYIAPVSWFIQHDIDKGRAALNVSEWGRAEGNSGDSAETVQNGSMPPSTYGILHPSVRLATPEKQAFIQGLVATFGSKDESKHKDKQDDK
ncbi:heme-binding domain-containing protein [Candidatus Methylomirabilis sp.]|uniref:heme-binding domain-containing protein n=1 Tax=Candidatus Methylomirabilis sp. TaxID=2032687 RepID=UPI002A611968|nr:heme-binding domain-containing protein [Candidatus Methylomirabilis sp.]